MIAVGLKRVTNNPLHMQEHQWVIGIKLSIIRRVSSIEMIDSGHTIYKELNVVDGQHCRLQSNRSPCKIRVSKFKDCNETLS